MTSVFQAVKNNDLKMLKKILKEKNTSAPDLKGALNNAAELGLLPLVKNFVRAGVKDDWAIVVASAFAPKKVVRYLYKNIGGDLDAALIAAAAHGRSDNVRFLLKTQATSLNEALLDAALKGYKDIVLLLMKKGANPYSAVFNTKTAFEIVSQKGRKDMLDLFNLFECKGK